MTWDKAAIQKILSTPLSKTGQVDNKKIVYKMLQALYQRQTADEQASGDTKHNNARGFNGFDAVFLSDVAQKSRHYGTLTDKQLVKVAKTLYKYSGQLAEIAAENQQMPLHKPPTLEEKKEFFRPALESYNRGGLSA